MPNAITRLTLDAVSAADLMADNPVSLHANATVAEATALLTDRAISAAPVIDDTGRPVGVVSKADILIHNCEQVRGGGASAPMSVAEIMTPAVFSISTGIPAAKVVEQMIQLNVNQLFVVDPTGTLVGVIGALDVLRHLQAE